MIFSFLSRVPNTDKRPACPRCGRGKLDRKLSRFAISRGRSAAEERAGDNPDLAGMDETRLEQAMAELAHEVEGVSEDDPRQMASLMRRLYARTGLRLGQSMEEAMRRMEAGEDPDRIEEEMGHLLEQEEPLFDGKEEGFKVLRRKLREPKVDETLYEL